MGRRDPKRIQRRIRKNSELTEVAQNAHNEFSRQRKGKNSKFPKLSENGMIMKSVSQYF